MKNITLPTEDGTTQIDHIIVSVYGIFVVETKNMKGWIFGSPNQRMWTQQIYKHKTKFQNPLHQNHKHVKTLQSLLGLNNQIESGRLTPSFKTHREHVKHVRITVAEKQANPSCPKCGSTMVMREAKKGPKQGNKFWGCSRFPQCRGIVSTS